AYASRGDAGAVAPNIRARAGQVVEAARCLFSSATADFQFVGAAELVALNRRTKTFSLVLPFVEHLSVGSGSYVLLARLADYYAFLRDEKGALRRYLFDSNVRDFLGDTGVNEDILASLRDRRAPEFWWLNNGVTMLATAAAVAGKEIS